MNALTEVPLPWARHDIENRLGFRGGRHTHVNTLFTMLLAAVMTVVFFCALIPIRTTDFAISFTERGPIPYPTVFFSAWAMIILLVKSRKLAYQRRALQYQVVSDHHQFVLSSANVDAVIDNIYATVDDPKNFVLFNRIVVALSNLRNLGQVTDVDDILRSQAANDESSMETSYLLLGGLVWAIPVLGFIGTVLGLSEAIGDFGAVLQGASDLSQIKGELQKVTVGLSAAFVTTLQALVAALFIQLYLTYLKKSEEEFLDACSEYCLRNVVNRLRIMPYEASPDSV